MSSITVLVAIAGFDEEYSETYASVLEKLDGTGSVSVVLGHVYLEEDAAQLEEMLDINPREADHLGTAVEHNTAVGTLSSSLDDLGIEYSVRGAIGTPTSEILEMADDVDADFILVGGRKRTPAGKALFGSSSQEILLESELPVIYAGAVVDDG